MNSNPRPGAALLLPWGSYRRFGWNHDEALLDPWPRLLARDVVYNDGVQVGIAARYRPGSAGDRDQRGGDVGGAPTPWLRADRLPLRDR